MVDLDDMRMFRALGTTHSLAGAARLLDVTPPALTVRLQKLEERLGVHLAVREARGISLTDEGTRLMLEVMSVDELTVEASVRPLHVLDAPTVTSGAEEEEEAEEELIDAADESAESEAEAQAEADTAAAEGEQPADSNDPTQHATEQGQ